MAEAEIHTDADERLTIDQVGDGSLLAATHVQRYELAAELCAGRRVVDLCCGTGYGTMRMHRTAKSVVGVDISQQAIDQAIGLAADAAGVRFVQGDALAYVEGMTAADVDVVVCFEGIEHVPDPEAVVDALARLAGDGVRILLSIPNSGAFEEDNDFHVTDFDLVSAEQLVERFPGSPSRIDQLHADSAVLLPADETALPDQATSVFDTDRVTEPGVAAHWIYAVGFDVDQLQDVQVRVAVVSRPHHYGYMLALERANRTLSEQNNRLARSWLGLHDASAGRSASLRGEVKELRTEREDLIERLESAVEAARQNDELFQHARVLLLEREQEIRLLNDRIEALRRSLRAWYQKVPRAVYRRLRRG